MRRSEIIEGVEQVLKAIDESNVSEGIRNVLTNREKSREVINNTAQSIQDYFAKSQNFNSSARQIAEILGLKPLDNPKFWVLLLNPVEITNKISSSIHEVYSSLNFAKENLPRIIHLLDREYSNSAQNNAEPIISNGKEMKLLSVTIFESDNRFSSPQRLVNVIESVDTFYSACAYIHEESPDTLSVVGCDSGSDKSFDFLGVAKVIECVTQLIENLWDRVVFYREKQLEVRLDLINQSLPIYDKLSELETGKKIEPELAERLRRNIFEGVNKFVESGASIPEIDARSTYSSRSLLSPVQKLLVSAPEEIEETESQQTTERQPNVFYDMPNEKLEANNLSSDEQSQLFELLKKMKESPKIENGNDIENKDFEMSEMSEE